MTAIFDIEGTNVTTGDTDWRAADPPVCPECGCDHSYWPWEMRDQYRATMRENAALRAQVARLREVIMAERVGAQTRIQNVTVLRRITNQRRREAWQAVKEHGDLDSEGEG